MFGGVFNSSFNKKEMARLVNKFDYYNKLSGIFIHKEIPDLSSNEFCS